MCWSSLFIKKMQIKRLDVIPKLHYSLKMMKERREKGKEKKEKGGRQVREEGERKKKEGKERKRKRERGREGRGGEREITKC